MDTISEISKTLKAAREAKGLSQRALARMAGVPQSHISKIENAGVDLRLSSLTQITRALDLELTLVPRKAVSAVKSIVRSAQPVDQRDRTAMVKELRKLKTAADKIAQRHSALKEAAQLQNRVHDLTRFEMPSSYLETIEKMSGQLEEIVNGPENFNRLVESLESVQTLRNALAHSSSEHSQKVGRSVYSLEDDDG